MPHNQNPLYGPDYEDQLKAMKDFLGKDPASTFPVFNAEIKDDGKISAEKVDNTETQKPFQADNDIAPLGLGLTIVEGRVVLVFDRPIRALALTAAEATKLGNGFLDRARQAK